MPKPVANVIALIGLVLLIVESLSLFGVLLPGGLLTHVELLSSLNVNRQPVASITVYGVGVIVLLLGLTFGPHEDDDK